MDQRILDTVRKIIQQREQIEDVNGAQGEFFFRYKGVPLSVRRIQSNLYNDESYSLYIYPKWKGSIADLAKGSSAGLIGEADMVEYQASTNQQAQDLFRDLWGLVKEKFLDLNSIIKHLLEE